MKLVVIAGLVLILFASVCSLAFGAAQGPNLQVGLGLFVPRDSSEWTTGPAAWFGGATNDGKVAGRISIGTTQDNSGFDLGTFWVVEAGGEYRIKALAPMREGKSDWYLGVGLSYASISQSTGDITVSDSAICPTVTIGGRSGKWGADVHMWWGKDSVDIGGTMLTATYSW